MEVAAPAPEPESNQINNDVMRCRELEEKVANLTDQMFKEASGQVGVGAGGIGPAYRAVEKLRDEASQERDLVCSQAHRQ
jgi:hypothetical protein